MLSNHGSNRSTNECYTNCLLQCTRPYQDGFLQAGISKIESSVLADIPSKLQ